MGRMFWVCGTGLAVMGALALMVFAHQLNLAGLFWSGVVGFGVTLVVARRLSEGVWYRNGIHTLLLVMLVVWPVGEWLTRQRPDPMTVPKRERAFSYEVARGNPMLFRNWWRGFVRDWERLFRAVKMEDPKGRLPFRLKPGTSMQFAESRIEVNSLGFRGREIEREKGERFRIVALGESTTMGVTLGAGDRPWPEVLEGLIRERMPGGRPVEVINAGVAGYTLEDGLVRLEEDVLPLEPDLLISYHGYNGYKFLPGAPVGLRENPPGREPRPSALLSEIEYRFRLRMYREKTFQPHLTPEQVARMTEGAKGSRYAELYGKLIRQAEAEDVPLVLVGFNMAVNTLSEDAVIEFYRGGFPTVMFTIQATRVHNALIESMAGEWEHVHYVDVSSGLDGEHAKFIDLVHFTQGGRDQLAENLYRGLEPLLRKMPEFAGAGVTD